MTDILSYEQLYTELTTLNANACDAIYNDDIEGFNNIINDIYNSGITQQERFPIAREAFRYSNIPILVNDIWFGPKADEILDIHIFHASNGLTIKDIKEKNDKEFYAFMVQNLSSKNTNTKPKQTKKKPSEQREEDFLLYLDKLAHLYDETDETKSTALVTNEKKYHKIFTDRIKELVYLRQQLYLAFSFLLQFKTPLEISDIKNKTEQEKIEILEKKLPNIYEKINTVRDREYLLTFENRPYSIPFSNYLEGKGINRSNWKNYHNEKKIKLPNNIMFYLQLAFYLTLPSSVEVEKFLNLHGYSIKTDMLILPNVKILTDYFVRCKDLCRWIDAGINYNVLNKLFGYELQKAEIKRPKTKNDDDQQLQSTQ